MKQLTISAKQNHLIAAGYMILLFSTAAVCLRTLFAGLDVDEQYAVTLAYRFANGDLLLKDLWEPHQTSALLPGFLTYLFLHITGSTEGLVLFLRFCGLLLQILLAAFWYSTLKKDFMSPAVILTAAVILNILPKWILTPEFSNQQIWFCTFTSLSLYRYHRSEKKRYLVLSALFLCLTVLAYPSSVLLFLPYSLWLLARHRRSFFLFSLVCFGCGLLFLCCLLTYLTFDEMLLYLGQILNDPTHSGGLFAKLLSYGSESFQLLLRIALYVLLAVPFSFLMYLLKLQKKCLSADNIFPLVFVISIIDQLRLWIFALVPAVYLQLHFLLLFLLGGYCYLRRKLHINESAKTLFSLFWLPSIFSLCSVCLLTNLDLKTTFVHLFPGILASVLFFLNEAERIRSESSNDTAVLPSSFFFRHIPALLVIIFWLTALVFSKGYLVRSNDGFPENIFVAKQKVLSGAAKGIYCPYMVGVRCNEDAQCLSESILPGQKILYIGKDMLLDYPNLQANVCSASTISTPVYSPRDLMYYEYNPDKMPDYVIVDRVFAAEFTDQMVLWNNWLTENLYHTETILSDYLMIYSR